MWKTLLACIVVFDILGKIECNGPPAGKCNNEYIVPVTVPIDEMEKHQKWRVIYTTDLDSVEDHEAYYISELRNGHNYKILNTKVLKDNSRSKYRFQLKYIDHALIEDTVDETGKPHRYYIYHLGFTKSLANLVYCCSDVGDPDIFYRFIAVPADCVPSDSEIQELLARDRAIFGDSHGTLVKLSEDIED